jgi:L-ribulose-5-phosphate 3-epimerase
LGSLSGCTEMLTAINAWTFPGELSPGKQLVAAAAAGFEGLELTVASEGPLRFDTTLESCATLARRATDLDLRIVSLASDEFWQTNYAAPDRSTRERAVAFTLQMLDRAVALAADAILVVPAVVGTLDEPQPRVSYADALHRTFDTLCSLRHEAESRGVTIALENVWNRFLLSPIEAADLLDRINSPLVGWYFDTGNVMVHGYPQDWIATLGGRIKRVHVKDYDLSRPGPAGFCPLGEGSVDWPSVIAGLRQAGYNGPLTYEGPGEPEEICRRLSNIINDRPILEKDEAR